MVQLDLSQKKVNEGKLFVSAHKDANRESLALCFLLWARSGSQVGGEKTNTPRMAEWKEETRLGP